MNAVVEAAFPVRVGIDHLLRAVFFSHAGKRARQDFCDVHDLVQQRWRQRVQINDRIVTDISAPMLPQDFLLLAADRGFLPARHSKSPAELVCCRPDRRCRRIVQENDKLAVTCRFGRFKRRPQPLRLAFLQLAELFKGRQILKADALCPYKRIILISREIVLQKEELSLKQRIQRGCFLRVPEHIMIAPDQDLAAGQLPDEIKIRAALFEIAAP